jgi:phosphoglycolate phosphatase
MAVAAGGRRFDVDAVVFDKDGTLIDLDATWVPIATTWITSMAGDDTVLTDRLALDLGVDLAGRRLVPDGLVAVGTLEQTLNQTIDSAERHGWDQVQIDAAVARSMTAVNAAIAAAPTVPLADIAGLFTLLVEGGVRVGVLTSDDRASADKFLAEFRIGHLVSEVVGGDAGHPPKPAPDGLLHITQSLGIPPERLLMVGDSMTDHGVARNAGAWFVAIGHGTLASAECDAVVASIAEITIVD